jgi:hypothetical protein
VFSNFCVLLFHSLGTVPLPSSSDHPSVWGIAFKTRIRQDTKFDCSGGRVIYYLYGHITLHWVLRERGEQILREVNTRRQGKEKQWQTNARPLGFMNCHELNCCTTRRLLSAFADVSLVKLSLSLIKHHAVKTWEWRHNSTILVLGSRWWWVVSFTPRPLYSRGKSPRYPLDRRLGGPQNRSGLCGG